MAKPWITVLSPTLTGNAVFRTQTVVRLLATQFDVQLIGFDATAETYGPLVDDAALVAERRYYSRNLPGWAWRVHQLGKVVRGAAIVCVKPHLGSFGAGLLLSRNLRRPLILDIDDWERGFLPLAPYWEARAWGLKWLWRTDSPLFIRVLDGFTYRAAALTVSNSFLQGIYGGHWVPHLRQLAPTRPAALAKPLEPRTVLFAGSPRGHKGLATLLSAWKRLDRKDAILRFAVPDPHDELLSKFRPLDVANVVVTGPHTFRQMPQILAEAAIVVVPQDNLSGSVGQLPSKLLDAMAAGKPIVATDVCDASRWLQGGAGVIVTPGSDEALARGLAYLLDHPEVGADMGAKALMRFTSLASPEELARRYCEIVAAVVDGHPLPAVPAFDSSLMSCGNSREPSERAS